MTRRHAAGRSLDLVDGNDLGWATIHVHDDPEQVHAGVSLEILDASTRVTDASKVDFQLAD